MFPLLPKTVENWIWVTIENCHCLVSLLKKKQEKTLSFDRLKHHNNFICNWAHSCLLDFSQFYIVNQSTCHFWLRYLFSCMGPPIDILITYNSRK